MRTIAFWLGAIECVVGVLVFCFLVWFFMVIASLGHPQALGVLAGMAATIAAVGVMARIAGDSERAGVVYACLTVLVAIPLVAAQLVASGAS